MYDYIIGEVVEIDSSKIVIENNQIGYQVFVANPYSYKQEKQKVWLYQHIKEDENSLYGFKTKQEKSLFIDLITVKGIGPKSALAIIVSSSLEQFQQAVLSEDLTYLQKFPKVGKKSAQQIVIDLKSKYEKLNITIDSTISNVEQEQVNSEVVDVLLALGYNKKDIDKKLKQIDKTLDVEEQVKLVLKQMVK